MFIPLPILIIALVIFCLLLWSNSKNSPKKTILDLDSTLMGTMTVSQAYHIASCYGDSIVKLSEAQKKAAHEESRRSLRSSAYQSGYLSHTTSQIRAALMLTVAQGVLNAKGDKNQFTAQKEFIVIAVDNDFTFNNELRPDIPFQFLNRCFLVYDQAFTSCTPDDIENILRWHGTPIAVIGKRFMVKFQCHIPAPVMIFIRWFLSVWKIHNFDVSNPKMPLTQPQLEFAANKVFGHAQQMFAWYRWITQARPCLSNSSEPSVILGVRLIEIAVAEAQLMSCRKLNEFFMPPNPRFPDDLKSAVFGYAATGGFITDADLEELHKRVAHLTTRSAESDPVSYEIYDISHAALSHSFPFFKYLSEHFYTPNSSESRHLLGAVGILQKLWDEWSSKVGPKKRKIISA